MLDVKVRSLSEENELCAHVSFGRSAFEEAEDDAVKLAALSMVGAVISSKERVEAGSAEAASCGRGSALT